MSAHTPILLPAREWSNLTELNHWLNKADSELIQTPPDSVVNGQKLGFDTYVAMHPKHASASRCLCDSGGGQLLNDILFGGQFFNVPLNWSWDNVTATQIVEGKKKRKVMRSQKLVLCCVENRTRRWFEVALLNDDLSYPNDPNLVGFSCLPFTDYSSAKRHFNLLISRARKELTNV